MLVADDSSSIQPPAPGQLARVARRDSAVMCGQRVDPSAVVVAEADATANGRPPARTNSTSWTCEKRVSPHSVPSPGRCDGTRSAVSLARRARRTRRRHRRARRRGAALGGAAGRRTAPAPARLGRRVPSASGRCVRRGGAGAPPHRARRSRTPNAATTPTPTDREQPASLHVRPPRSRKNAASSAGALQALAASGESVARTLFRCEASPAASG